MNGDPAGALRVVVGVLAFRRAHLLGPLLTSLTAQAREVDADVRLLVVDNDAAASSADAVTRHAAAEPAGRTSYVVEPEPGIAAARNRVLAESAGDDVLVFIDDDELPEPGWLAALLGCFRTSGAAGVAGAVVSRFDVEPDDWVRHGRFFERLRPATGTELRMAATNNLLLDLRVVREVGLRFDVRYGLSGGSDTLFTRHLVHAGHRLVWCDEAVVTDLVPAARATRRWVLLRAMRSGNGWSRVSLELAGGRVGRGTRRVSLLGAGLVRVLGGSAQWVLGALGHRLGTRARGARTVARGAGMAGGALGWWYHEYRRPAAGTPVLPATAGSTGG